MTEGTRQRSEVHAGRCADCDGELVSDGNTLRCACGSLLARYSESGIELKCRRCKRTHLIRNGEHRGSEP